jgi:uncharacterized coiled-coil protein SlyX
MKNHIEQTITTLNSEIARLQAELAPLQAAVAVLCSKLPPVPRGKVPPQATRATRARVQKINGAARKQEAAVLARPVAPRQVPAGALALLDRPTTIGGAMKQLITATPKFTSEDLRTALVGQYPDLAGQDDFQLRFTANLGNWKMTGKLDKTGEVYSVVNKEFFATAA